MTDDVLKDAEIHLRPAVRVRNVHDRQIPIHAQFMHQHQPNPIAQLMQEHDDALLQLKLLNKAVRAFSSDGYSAQHFRQIQALTQEVDPDQHIKFSLPKVG